MTRSYQKVGWLLGALLSISGCDPAMDTVDAGSARDAGPVVDSGALDSGALDSGALDSGALDSGALDSGALDSGALDSGALDGGGLDSGALDGGGLDSGALDGGALGDAGVDAGPMNDGGPDAGPADAGPPEIIAPSATVVFPPARSLTDRDTLTLRGTASDASAITEVRVEGVLVESSDSYATWTVTIPLALGQSTLQVAATDEWGNTESAITSVEVERVDPMLIGPNRVVYADASHAFIHDAEDGIIFDVDLGTGARVELARASGIRGLTYDASNSRLLYSIRAAVVAVDTSSGASTTLSDNSVASAVDFDTLSAAAFTSTTGYVFDRVQGIVIEVNLATGVRTELSGPSSTGPAIESPNFMSLDVPRDRLLFAHGPAAGAEVLAIDVESGDRSVYGALSSRLWGPFVVDSLGRIVYGYVNEEVRRFDGTTETTLITLGPPSGMAYPSAFALISDERALMIDNRVDALFELDLSTGSGSLLSRSEIGTGTPIYSSYGIAHGGGDVFILDLLEDSNAFQLDRIDSLTGIRTEISGVAGSGPALTLPRDLQVSADGTTAWSLSSYSRLVEVDVASGVRALLASDSSITGGPMGRPASFAMDMSAGATAEGVAYLLDATSSNNRVLALDLATSVLTVLGSDTAGTGFALSSCTELILDGARLLLGCTGGVVALDLESGERTLVASASRVQQIVTAGDGLFFYSRGFDLWRVEGTSAAVEITSSGSMSIGIVQDLGYDSTTERLTLFSDRRHSIMVVDAPTGERVITYR